jgi:hypothetical protein
MKLIFGVGVLVGVDSELRQDRLWIGLNLNPTTTGDRQGEGAKLETLETTHRNTHIKSAAVLVRSSIISF